jgi:hypothetical protein
MSILQVYACDLWESVLIRIEFLKGATGYQGWFCTFTR